MARNKKRPVQMHNPDLDRITSDDIGFAAEVCQKFVGDDKMVFVDGCKNPKSVTLLLRAVLKGITVLISSGGSRLFIRFERLCGNAKNCGRVGG